MKREAFFSLVFQGKKSLFITGHAKRVGCVFFYFSVTVCNIVIGHLGRPHSTHTAPMPVLTGSVHAPILTKPSRAGFSVSRSKLIEPGVATCSFRGVAGPRLESLEHTYQVQVPVSFTITVIFLVLDKFWRARRQRTFRVGRTNVYHVEWVPETSCKR